MLQGGLVSITFRKLDARAVVDLVSTAGLRGIEWGGDVHVPHGDTARAREVGAMTRDAGLRVAAYGSYYRVGVPDGPTFEEVRDSAVALGAPWIRVWPGNAGSADASPEARRAIEQDALRIAELAAEAGLKVGYEFHANTLTDTAASAAALLETTAHPAVATFWQPPNGMPTDEALRGLETVVDHVVEAHVFAWESSATGGVERFPLSRHRERWRRYLGRLHATDRDMFALLEFVRDDAPAQFREDAATLRELIAEVCGEV